ncbi:HCP-like protein [Westerdykella ornata]|uniref:HCP-like protein n=1 Tax=Westerdykella ornata TaxID=318751 RepID=A0A6A6JM47_WESOR|nr:HCP-like protein [Westerdykella ornata]KAF2277572.1 HCP-like protein [Westerdykella ornata]
MPEVPEHMQENITHLELEANAPRAPMSPPAQAGLQAEQRFPPRSTSFQHEQPPHDAQAGNWPARHQSISSTFKQPPTVQPQTIQQDASHDYSQFGGNSDIPNFSVFPKLPNRPPNVPPSDDEKEAVLENARLPVLNSNDPEMQLAWAQDALQYVDIAMLQEQRLAESQPARPVTPQVEHQLRVDAMNVVQFLADQHHPKAEFLRGTWLEFGKFGLRVDKKEAFRCYSRAASKGYARAEYRMGMAYEQSQDPIKALQHYKRGSEAGDSASNYRLGMMTLLGQHGQPQDFAKGVQLIKQAAETADENAPQGAYVLGMLYARELPQINVPEIYLPYDEQAAKQNIEKAAYLGFAKAQVKMGSAYELCSLGCEFSPILSLHYNALASRQGEPEADMAISKWFLCGYDGEFAKNEELAYEYARRAALAGLPTAEFAMGYFNEIGMHIPVNIEKALEWYEKAAKNGNKDAVGRIESISKSNRTLSKTDHEKVAINRIKSQHGSMRGQRPARLQKMAAPALPTVADEYGERSPTRPDRGTTPYPISDQPPIINASAPLDRPATAAPYPLDNGPPRVGSARPPMAGGFAPELRSASTRPPPGPAFNIHPSVYGPNDPYGRGQPPPQGPGNMGALPLRPHTSMDEMGQGRGRIPSGGRTPGGGPPPGPGAYRQPGGPGIQRPEAYDRPPTVQPVDIGYVAPDGRNRLQKQGGPPPGKQPILPDVGYVAPLEPRQHTRPSTVQPGQESRTSSRPDRPSTAAPGPGPGLSPSGRPSRDPSPQTPQAGGAQRPPPLKQQQPQGQAQGGKPAGPKPAAPTTPGKGPKTFDEMGIGAPPKESDCVVM